MSKWGARPHWEYDARWLGEDEHGEWLGIPAGTLMTRPGATYVAPTDQIGLVPAADAEDRGWLAWFHAAGSHVVVYVDITTAPSWDGTVLRAVDLDLDVIRMTAGEVKIDDEDEFAEHQLEFGYPPEIIVGARASCDLVHAAVLAQAAPYDGTALTWLAQVPALGSRAWQ
jgi:hypothetical protein